MYYGFDIGGTKIVLGVFDKDLKLQWETRVPTPRDSYDEFLTAIAALVAQADERFGVKGSVGIGIPGMPRNRRRHAVCRQRSCCQRQTAACRSFCFSLSATCA